MARRRNRPQGIPSTAGVADPQVARILDAIRENLAQQESVTQRVNQLNRVIGAVDESIRGLIDGYRPGPVAGLTASGIFGAVLLEAPGLPAQASYLEWLASDTDDAGTATVVGASFVPLFSHSLTDPAGRYYWVRAVGAGNPGKRGPLNQAAGTYAKPAPDPEFLLDQISERIRQSDLDQALQQEIDKITGDGPESVNARIADEARARADAIQAEAVARANAIDAERDIRIAEIDTERSERIADVLDEAQARADALLNERNVREAAIENEQQIRQSADESLSLEISTLAAGTGEQFDSRLIWYFDTDLEGWGGGAVTNGYIVPDNGTEPTIESPAGLAIDGDRYHYVKGRIKRRGNPAWVGELEWRVTGDSAWQGPITIDEPPYQADGDATIDFKDIVWTGEIDQIRLRLPESQTDTDRIEIDWVAIGRPTPGASVASLQQEREARISANSAQSLARETLAAQMRGDYEGTDAAQVTQGLVYSERQARVTAQESIASDVEAVQAKANNNDAAIIEEREARAAGDEASARRTEAVEARFTTVDLVLAPGQSPSPATQNIVTNARVQTEEIARANEDEALGQRIDTVTGQVGDNSAALQTEQTARVSGDEALGQRVDTAQAKADGNTAAIQTEQTARSDADGALSQRLDIQTAATDDNAAAIEAERIARTDADGLLASDIETLQGRADSADGEREAATAARQELSNEIQTLDDLTQAQSQDITDVQARLRAFRLESTFGFETGELGQGGAPVGWHLEGYAGQYVAAPADSPYGSALAYQGDTGAWAITKAFSVQGGGWAFAVDVRTQVFDGHAYALLTCRGIDGAVLERAASSELLTDYDGVLSLSHTLPAATRYVELSLRASKLIAA